MRRTLYVCIVTGGAVDLPSITEQKMISRQSVVAHIDACRAELS